MQTYHHLDVVYFLRKNYW